MEFKVTGCCIEAKQCDHDRQLLKVSCGLLFIPTDLSLLASLPELPVS